MLRVLDPVYTNVGKRPIVPRGESSATAYSFKFRRDSNPNVRTSISVQATRLEDFLCEMEGAIKEDEGVLRYSTLRRLENKYSSN